MPAGRPTLYRPEYCEKVVEFGKKGLSAWEMAMNLDVTRCTLYDWAAAHEEFEYAFTRARDYSKATLFAKSRDNEDNKDYQPKITQLLYRCLHDINPQIKNSKSYTEFHENAVSQAAKGEILSEQLESLSRAIKDGIHIENESELKPTLEKIKELIGEQKK